MNTHPKYDVAISFLSADEPTAKAVAGELEASGLQVFFYPRAQEELAGTDGLESMRAPFIEARLSVVLYRDGWGETPWTRVEATAIKDRCLESGWISLMFVALDKSGVFPKWLPTTHIRFNLSDYGIEQLVGAIKLRVQEQGGMIKLPDAISEAKRVRQEQLYLQDRDHLMRDRDWIVRNVHASLQTTMVELVRLTQQLNSEEGFSITCIADERSCVLRSGFVSLPVQWRQPIFNSVGKDAHGDCFLRVSEFSGAVLGPGERAWVMHKPLLLREHRFEVGVGQDRALVWTERDHKGHISPDKLADRIMRIFLDLVARANQGKVQRPSDSD